MTLAKVHDWAGLLERVAGPLAAKAAPALPGSTGEAFACAVNGAKRRAPHPLPSSDAGLWWAIVDPNARQGVNKLVDMTAGGPLLAPDQFLAIEVWTESELCALHALVNLGLLERRVDWMQRAERARDWHLEHTQPDNATGRPWAIHAFILAGSPDAQHYAETLLHNCMALSGAPDATSAWILLDAARALEKIQKVKKSKGQHGGRDAASF